MALSPAQKSRFFEDGYLSVFPNFKHDNTKEGFGCKELSPKAITALPSESSPRCSEQSHSSAARFNPRHPSPAVRLPRGRRPEAHVALRPRRLRRARGRLASTKHLLFEKINRSTNNADFGVS